MISFQLEEEETLLQDTVHSFAEADIRPVYRDAEKSGVPAGLRQKFHGLGLTALDLPEDLGGAGMRWTARVIALEELGWGDPSVAVDLGHQAGVMAILELGDAAQKKRFLAPLGGPAGAEFRAALAFSESAARDGGGCSTTARLQGDFYVIDGEKAYVHGAAQANLMVVFAQVDASKGWDGIGAFVVEKGTAGVTFGEEFETTGLGGVPKTSLKLSGVTVSPANRLQGCAASFVDAVDAMFRKLSLKTAAIATGLARASYEYALKYSEERVAFGKPIGHFQFISFTLADMATTVDAARWMVWRAACELDQGRDGRTECAMAFAHALETAMFAADWAVQVLGGHGYIVDHPVEKWMRDAKTLALWTSTREHANAVVADAVLGVEATARDRLPVHDIQPVLT